MTKKIKKKTNCYDNCFSTEENNSKSEILELKEKCNNLENCSNLNENNWPFENEDEDDLLIDFLIKNYEESLKENQNQPNREICESEISDESEDSSYELDNLEDEYIGKPLVREQQLEKLFLKYAKPLCLKKKPKTAINLTREIEIELGEGKYKNYVLVNKEPFLINNRITRNFKEVIGLHLNKSRFGFSYFCNYFDERFNRICFQPFKCKKEVIDHYYSLHLQKLKNYFCNDENCKKAYTFYKQMKGHLLNCHGVTQKFDKHFTRLSYQFTERWNIEDLALDKHSVLVRNRVLEID